MRSLHVPPKRFAWQMRLLSWMGYRGLGMSALHPYLSGEKQGKVVGITFDDGYRNNLTHALPVLNRWGFSATCYLISQQLGGVNHWDLDKGIPENPLMSEEEVRAWINGGMEIGSHTRNHLRLTSCSHAQSNEEISLSRPDLEQQFDTAVDHFCYPWGEHNETIQSQVESAGYLTATTTRRGRATPLDYPLLLPRIPITHHTLPHLFVMKILSQYEDNHG